jgi:hypothetical protein
VEDISPEINIPEVEDPNKPPPPAINDDGTDKTDPKTITPPKPKNVKIKKIKNKVSTYDVPKPVDSASLKDYTKELDSVIANTNKPDSAKNKNINSANNNASSSDTSYYVIPDSLSYRVDTNSVPIKFAAYKEWKFVRQDSASFYLNYGSDTLNKKGDSLTIYIYLNSKFPEDRLSNYTKDFKLRDSIDLTAKYKEPYPKLDPGTDYNKYYFIILNKLDRINISFNIHKSYTVKGRTQTQMVEDFIRSLNFRTP